MRVLLALMLLGCSSDRVDACSAAGSDPCVTFHLTAEPMLADALITSVAMWVTYESSAGLRNQLVQTKMQAPTRFPIAVGLDFMVPLTTAAKVRIAALTGPGPAGYRVVMAAPSAGQHLDQEVMMQRQELSGCFNNARNTGESDVDCGGDCSPCPRGLQCLGPADCQSSLCVATTCD